MAEALRELLTSKNITAGKGVIYISDPEASFPFENLYLKVREKEGRIYPDSVVIHLPDVEGAHPLYREWQIRGVSLNKLMTALTQKQKPMTILDLGCGNGWIANRLAQIPQCRVYAVDLNQLELEQGARVFSETASLHFVYGNIFDNIFHPGCFDLILLASAIQYFPDPGALLSLLTNLLRDGGEIHIIDSPFYTEKSTTAARQRSINYFQELGHPGMVDHYHHHRLSELAGFNYEMKYNPKSYFLGFQRRFFKKIISPFPWIVIRR